MWGGTSRVEVAEGDRDELGMMGMARVACHASLTLSEACQTYHFRHRTLRVAAQLSLT